MDIHTQDVQVDNKGRWEPLKRVHAKFAQRAAQKSYKDALRFVHQVEPADRPLDHTGSSDQHIVRVRVLKDSGKRWTLFDLKPCTETKETIFGSCTRIQSIKVQTNASTSLSAPTT